MPILQMTSHVVPAPDDDGYLARFWLFEEVTQEKEMLHAVEQRAAMKSCSGSRDEFALLQLADQAMYEAKKRGKNNWQMHRRSS